MYKKIVNLPEFRSARCSQIHSLRFVQARPLLNSDNTGRQYKWTLPYTQSLLPGFALAFIITFMFALTGALMFTLTPTHSRSYSLTFTLVPTHAHRSTCSHLYSHPLKLTPLKRVWVSVPMSAPTYAITCPRCVLLCLTPPHLLSLVFYVNEHWDVRA